MEANHPKNVNVAEAPINCTIVPANQDPIAIPEKKGEKNYFFILT